ncbi:N-6 DNA methylase [Campylobacter sp. faydin G-24]|uniref:site-specific DNA-methyltransferase (adenine-specific) n=1 Tax=Campylobacter anatolicus TaxID=2829105 RepID=A0ABS5HLR1_9BACT|nr:N-6 DNA methylase [Campylobacter anatolicus]MBR8464692.1 N-6 DNA methylase [Campylobacter anatolicus]
MSLFQSKIIKNAIRIDADIQTLYKIYMQNYKAKADFISSVKEEAYQDGFLRDIFVALLGYTLKSDEPLNFNLSREHKNQTDGKKADAAIVIDGVVKGVIELKDCKTKNLNDVEAQAFNYHNSHANSRYIIISNFAKLRFYIDKKTGFEEFDLLNLSLEEFAKLHLLLSFKSIKNDTPQTLKQKSLAHDKEISKQLYKDFSDFRTNLFKDLCEHNPNHDKSALLSYASKLCDRFIFIIFAEDKNLLPQNVIISLINDHKANSAKGFGAKEPLYAYFKRLFAAIDKGDSINDIAKFNGGLFATDNDLDALIISDAALNLDKLSEYDFQSEVGVNILGHIFEQSLSDLEELNAQINGESFDKTKSKRKKDGVFYTPEFITAYIVDSTLGELCRAKKRELNLQEITPPKNSKKLTATETKNLENFKIYKDFLLGLKVLDPACGSGAFLTQALEFLIKENAWIYKEISKFGNILEAEFTPESVLENNLYGVDINDDATQIAKLSLWLRTAQKGRVLTTLSNNIKTANSLLEFPFDFKFDCIIGNPPYVRVQGLKENYEKESEIYESKFASAIGKYDIYVLFLEFGFSMLKTEGKLGFILPHNFLTADFGVGIRKILSQNKAVEKLVHFGSNLIFQDASTYTCITIVSYDNDYLKFCKTTPNQIFNDLKFQNVSYKNIDEQKWLLNDKDDLQILNKIYNQPYKIKDIFSGIFQGIISGDNDIFYLKNCKDNDKFIVGFNTALNDYIKIERGITKRILNGKTIKKYGINYNNEYIIYPYELKNGKTTLIDEINLKEKYPLAYEFLLKFYDRLSNRGSANMKYRAWYSLWNCKNMKNLSSKKILTPDICFGCSMWLDENAEYFYNDTSYAFVLDEKQSGLYKIYLAILNSSVKFCKKSK